MEDGNGMALRKHAYKKAGVYLADARERRRLESTQFTKQHREGRLRAKRLKREQKSQGLGFIALLDDETLASELGSIKSTLASSPESKVHLDALVRLRQIISAAGDATSLSEQRQQAEHVLDEICKSRLISVLIQDLLPKHDSESSRKAAFEACWALSNLAALEHKSAQEVVNAGPVLVAHLSGGFGISIAEQSAWTIGNLAGDCQEFRTRLLANGALLPLARLAMRGRFRSESATVLAAAQTAAWALCNLIKSVGPEIKELTSLKNFKPGLRELLGRTDFVGLVTEAAWVTAYATASTQTCLTVKDVLKPLLDLLPQAVSQLQDEEAGHPPATLTPVLRSLGNLTASGDTEELAAEFAANARSMSLIIACTQCKHHGIVKEAAWLFSNLAALQQPGKAGQPILAATGGVSTLVQLLKDGTFPIRREAAFGIANLMSVDPSLLPKLVGETVDAVPGGVLPAIAGLCKSSDADVALLVLRILAAVLQQIPEGPQMVESVEGMEILEEQQMRGVPDAQEIATKLLDQFYGDDYGL